MYCINGSHCIFGVVQGVNTEHRPFCSQKRLKLKLELKDLGWALSPFPSSSGPKDQSNMGNLGPGLILKGLISTGPLYQGLNYNNYKRNLHEKSSPTYIFQK